MLELMFLILSVYFFVMRRRQIVVAVVLGLVFIGSAMSAGPPKEFLGIWTSDPCRGAADYNSSVTITPNTYSFDGEEEDGFKCKFTSFQSKGNSLVVNMICQGEGETSKSSEIWYMHITGDGPSFNQLITIDPKASRVTVLHHCHG